MSIDKHHLYNLLLLDVSSRLDILMLEIGNVQQLIIYLLKEPVLYTKLVNESNQLSNVGERLLKDKYEKNIFSPDYIKNFVDNTIELYSKPDEEDSSIKDLNINELFNKWTREQRRNYFALGALQILKRKVFSDKVNLYIKAERFKVFNNNADKEFAQKSAFLVFRSALMKRIEDYLAGLNTHKQLLEKSLNFSTKEFPRPEISRRKEIGIFQDFLSARIVDLKSEMFNLIKDLAPHSTNIRNRSEVDFITLHGWSRDNSMSNYHLFDENTADQKNPQQNVIYIDTSFWLPDRPDLQPLIAKELAVSLNRYLFGNFNQVYVSQEKLKKKVANKFVDFYSELYSVMSQYCQVTDNTVTEQIKSQLPEFSRIVMDDLLAVSCKGVSYLYALFLMIIANNTYKFLEVDGRVELGIVDDLDFGGGSVLGIISLKENFSWYFRLKIVSLFLGKIYDCSDDDKALIKSVCEVSSDFLNFIEKNNPANAENIKRNWDELLKEIEYLIENHARKWKILHEIKERKNLAPHDFMNKIVRKGLKEYEGIFIKKRFQHLKDVPYQLAIYDVQKKPLSLTVLDDISLLNNAFFSLGLEFYLWGRESSKLKRTLILSIMFVEEYIKLDQDPDVLQRLGQWCYGSSHDSVNFSPSSAKKLLSGRLLSYDDKKARKEIEFKIEYEYEVSNKLKEFNSILKDLKNNNYQYLINDLLVMLRLHLAENKLKTKFQDELIDYFFMEVDGERIIRKVLVSRFDITNTTETNQSKLSLYSIMGNLFVGNYNDETIVPVLGEYEAVQLLPLYGTNHEHKQYKLMRFDRHDNNSLPLYFARRETSIAFYLGKKIKNKKLEYLLKGKFHFISVINLQHREMRLSFVYRMLNRTNELFDGYLQKLSDHYDIVGLLTDGWGDLLLVFYPTEKQEDYNFEFFKDFFNLQKNLHKDFMVERTESIVTPYVLDYKNLIQEVQDGKCKVVINARLMENRNLISDLVDQKLDLLMADFEVLLTPGKLDLQLTPKLALLNELVGSAEKLYLGFLKKINSKENFLNYIDRLETTIMIQQNCASK